MLLSVTRQLSSEVAVRILAPVHSGSMHVQCSDELCLCSKKFDVTLRYKHTKVIHALLLAEA